MKTLATLVTDLENALPFLDKKNEAISQVTVGWHIEHSLLALIKMITATEHSNPAEYKKTFNWKRTLVITIGKIPRGKARVPSSVKPGNEVSVTTIKPLLEKAKEKVALFETLSSDKYFTHPVFEDVKLYKARRVIAIHTIHHIKIINDILKP